ncbi:cytochrome P450 [Westerdykella ornata]|uniref:Cytochrome P450 n=1 Tax=Westerdykella ornata TaxID=318751 RepID=A0A6A6JWN5_WESOR|nr:cytochrome P450 [Westerdykella ornata]KAF2280228.1 cytochrome P450 [Westerdykella ornata]
MASITIVSGLLLPLFFIYTTLYFWTRQYNRRAAHFWHTLRIPAVGVQDDAWLRAIFWSVTRSATYAFEGYQRFSLRNLVFVAPSTGCGAIVVLPPSHLNVLNKSENELQAFHVQLESHQPRYTMGDPEVWGSMLHYDVVRNQLSKDVGHFVRMTDEELAAGFRDYCGRSSDWATVNLWDVCTKVIARAGNRAFVGLPLCRDETLLEQTRVYATNVYGCATVITALPPILQPVLGHLIALPAQWSLYKCKKILIPFVQERLDMLQRGSDDMPNDVLQWLIQRCAKAGPKQTVPGKVAERLLILNLVSIFTTTFTFSNCILDLYSSANRDDFLAGLRAECDKSAALHNGLLTKTAIDQLYRVDSTIRESMRTSMFGIIALFREVAPGTELDLNNGIRIPSGVRIGVPCQPIHYDESRYCNASEFDAFRFSRAFEGPCDATGGSRSQKLSVDLDESFLTYGYGRHACPGRWLASQIMKQALAHLVQNYDVEVVEPVPERKALLNMILPPVGAQIRVRPRSSLRN